jgi:hypothetical protein
MSLTSYRAAPSRATKMPNTAGQKKKKGQLPTVKVSQLPFVEL